MVHDIGLRIDGDVAAQQPEFVVTDARVCFLQRHFIVAQALDLASFEDNSALQLLENLVLVPGSPVSTDGARIGISGASF
jgi:hypothetical protein